MSYSPHSRRNHFIDHCNGIYYKGMIWLVLIYLCWPRKMTFIWMYLSFLPPCVWLWCWYCLLKCLCPVTPHFNKFTVLIHRCHSVIADKGRHLLETITLKPGLWVILQLSWSFPKKIIVLNILCFPSCQNVTWQWKLKGHFLALRTRTDFLGERSLLQKQKVRSCWISSIVFLLVVADGKH